MVSTELGTSTNVVLVVENAGGVSDSATIGCGVSRVAESTEESRSPNPNRPQAVSRHHANAMA